MSPSTYRESETQTCGDVAVSKHMPQRQAPAEHDVPRYNLRNRPNGTGKRTTSKERSRRLSQAQETELVNWIDLEEILEGPLTKPQIREIAQLIVLHSKDDKPITIDWVDEFLERRGDLTVSLLTGRVSLTNVARATRKVVNQQRCCYLPADRKAPSTPKNQKFVEIDHLMYTPRSSKDVHLQLELMENHLGPVDHETRTVMEDFAKSVDRLQATRAALKTNVKRLKKDASLEAQQ